MIDKSPGPEPDLVHAGKLCMIRRICGYPVDFKIDVTYQGKIFGWLNVFWVGFDCEDLVPGYPWFDFVTKETEKLAQQLSFEA